MKSFKLLSILLVFVLSLSIQNQAQAQIIDSLPYFKADLLINQDKLGIDLQKGFLIPNSMKGQFVLFSASMPKVKEIKGTVVLKNGNECFEFGCTPSATCNDCKLLWWDRNGDGKIQPKRELRCVCQQGNTQCRMRVRKVKCE